MMPAPSPSANAAAAGIYVHVPFCLQKCQYCDFYSVTDLRLIPDFLDALRTEIDRCKKALPVADSVYFGGGTPSMLSPRQVKSVLDVLHDRFAIDASAEITLEVNPGTVDREKLVDYRAVGVNRINIGLQSLDDSALRLLGRIHSARQGRDAFRWAVQSGFDNIGLDLIYGIPGQTETQWAAELSAAANLGAAHLSCYMLTLEARTPLFMDVKRGRVAPLDEALTAALFAFTTDYLNRHGYRQYEVSNYALVANSKTVDYRSRHNRKYWTLAPYLGVGPAAHSFLDGRRWWNVSSLEEYLNALKSGKSPVAGTETLDREQQIMEYVYLGLRQTAGIDTLDFESRYELNFYRWYEHEIALLLTEGLLEIHHQWLRTTPKGMRFLDQVVERLIG